MGCGQGGEFFFGNILGVGRLLLQCLFLDCFLSQILKMLPLHIFESILMQIIMGILISEETLMIQRWRIRPLFSWLWGLFPCSLAVLTKGFGLEIPRDFLTSPCLIAIPKIISNSF